MIKYIYNGLIHISLVVCIILGVNEYNKNKKLEDKLKSTEEVFDIANKIVSISSDKQGNEVITSMPNLVDLRDLESGIAQSTKNLIDSASEALNLPSNAKVLRYSKTSFKSEITAKAQEVNDTLATYKDNNWELSYNIRDSIFNGIHYSNINELDYMNRKTFLGIPIGQNKYYQSSWLTDTTSKINRVKTVVVNKPVKPKFQIYSHNKFRTFDNSLLSGVELNYDKGRFNLGGSYLYNFNTRENEYEVALKFGIFK